jgi:uncharacterized protein involved in exopolysaccharide biosynthesis
MTNLTTHQMPPPGPGESHGSESVWLREGPSLAEILAALIRFRWVVIAVPAIAVILTAVVTFLSPATFTSSASFLPKAAEGQMSQLALLANQFGMTAQDGNARQSPAIFAYLLRSDAVLLEVVEETFSTSQGRNGTIVELLEVKGAGAAEKRMRAVRELKKLMTVSTGQPSGGVHFAVTTEDPTLSYQLADHLLERLNEINLRSRQAHAGEERRFIEAQIEQVGGELGAAEYALQRFLEQNRHYSDASAIRFEGDRLARDLTLKQGRLASLLEVYDQVRIREIRTAPLLDVLEAPFTPVGPDDKGLVMRVIVAFFLGGLLALLIVALLEFGRRLRPALEDADEAPGTNWKTPPAPARSAQPLEV